MPLRKALGDADATVESGPPLRRHRRRESLLPDVTGLLTDTAVEVRLAATEAIGELGGDSASLLALIDDPDPAVRAQAASWVESRAIPLSSVLCWRR